jgi:hypothetical protein
MAETTTAPATGAEAQETERQRERSTVVFVYNDLDDAVEVAKAVHAGGSTMDALAARLQMAATGGGFRMKLLAAKTFGLVNYTKESIRLTPLGLQVNDPVQEPVARAEAFLNVELYQKLYDAYRNVTLPPTDAALEAKMVEFGVALKQRDKARQVFQRAAQQAGFFEHGTDRLVRPVTPGLPPPGGRGGGEKTPKPKGGGAGDDGGDGLDPVIDALIKKLPDPNQPWPLDKRVKWLRWAANALDMLYPEDETGSEIAIALQKKQGSAQ